MPGVDNKISFPNYSGYDILSVRAATGGFVLKKAIIKFF